MTFVEKFCPVNEAWSAIMHLESQEYHQGSRDVKSYIDKFEDLVEISGYTDPILIVLKFCQGLNTAIQNKVAESGQITLTTKTSTAGMAPQGGSIRTALPTKHFWWP